MSLTTWRKCAFCKKPINFSTKYWTCNVSTCNQKATSYAFCSVMCWDGHVPVYRHRDAWAKEQHSPTQKEYEASLSAESMATPTSAYAPSTEQDVLVVVSKVKTFIRETSGMNTSDSVMKLLSQKVREACDKAIVNAKNENRQTVMDRDFIRRPS